MLWNKIINSKPPVIASGRGVFGGGGAVNIMDYITIATTGNAASFGDLSVARTVSGSGSSAHGGLT